MAFIDINIREQWPRHGVYMIQFKSGIIKIGSGYIRGRISDLKPYLILAIIACDNESTREIEIHMHIAKNICDALISVGHDWFRPTEGLLLYIKSFRSNEQATCVSDWEPILYTKEVEDSIKQMEEDNKKARIEKKIAWAEAGPIDYSWQTRLLTNAQRDKTVQQLYEAMRIK